MTHDEALAFDKWLAETMRNAALYFEYVYLYGSKEGKRRFLEDGHSV